MGAVGASGARARARALVAVAVLAGARALVAAARASVAVAVALAIVTGPAAGVAWAAGWTWPVEGAVVTGYSYAGDPYAGGQHRGIDLAAPAGTPVRAATGGTVRFAGVAGSSGLTVALRTADGRHDTSYLHLGSVSVAAGASVSAGDALGAVGMTGDRSAALPHLHFGVRVAGPPHGYRDPLRFLAPRPHVRDLPRGVPIRAPAPIRLAPRRVPVRAPVPVHLAPRRAPGPAPLRAPVPVRAPARVRAPAPVRPPVPFPAGPRPVAAPATGGAGPRAARAARWSPGTPLTHPAGGLDTGWAIACAGAALTALALVALLWPGAAARASSIGRACRTTSQRRSTT